MRDAVLTTSEPDDFGIMMSCYRGDLPFLRGCLASLREHLPPLPITLIKHGEFDTRQLCDVYAVSVLDRQSVDVRLQEHSYGYGLTKMIAFWHSPYKRFLHVDPDAVAWGNFIDGIPYAEYDLIYNEPHEIITPFLQTSQYFDPQQMFPTYEEFPWRGNPYFNSGTFVARRGMFELDEYLDLLTFYKKHPTAIFADQGMINFMAFRMINQGKLKARQWPLQAIVRHWTLVF